MRWASDSITAWIKSYVLFGLLAVSRVVSLPDDNLGLRHGVETRSSGQLRRESFVSVPRAIRYEPHDKIFETIDKGKCASSSLGYKHPAK
jgi:hypothetical protein